MLLVFVSVSIGVGVLAADKGRRKRQRKPSAPSVQANLAPTPIYSGRVPAGISTTRHDPKALEPSKPFKPYNVLSPDELHETVDNVELVVPVLSRLQPNPPERAAAFAGLDRNVGPFKLKWLGWFLQVRSVTLTEDGWIAEVCVGPSVCLGEGDTPGGASIRNRHVERYSYTNLTGELKYLGGYLTPPGPELSFSTK